MTTFNELGLAPAILKALEDEGYTTPTPIQAQAIQPVMAGHDLLGIAQTGTGKTAAFALPILHRLAADRRPAPRKGCRALVLSPTRELATQIADSFRAYGRHLGFSVATVFGGVGPRPQIQALARGVDVLVATPGRLLDHMGARHAALAGTEILVLDEADQMLDLGFVKPIRQIVATLAARRQNLFFSATMPREIAGLADEMLRDPVRISVAPVGTTVERVSQRVIHVEATRKRELLAELINSDAAMTRTLVFTRTKRGADRVAKSLELAGIDAAAIHGNKSQRQREEALEDFRRSKVRVLVATDIAARGIDIDLVTHVVNYELPEVPEAYVHRIGRTARAGAEGIAISFCDAEERDQLRAIERLTRQTIASEDRRDARAAAAAQANGGGRDRGAGKRSDGGSRRGGENHRQPRNGGGERRGQSASGGGERRGQSGPSGHGQRGQERRRANGGHGGHAHGVQESDRHHPGRRDGGRRDETRGTPDRRSNPGAGIAGVAFMAQGARPRQERSGNAPRKRPTA